MSNVLIYMFLFLFYYVGVCEFVKDFFRRPKNILSMSM